MDSGNITLGWLGMVTLSVVAVCGVVEASA